jgi:hypothetical protein
MAALNSSCSGVADILPLHADPDLAACTILTDFAGIPQVPTDTPFCPAACRSRLARETTAATVLLLESGMIVSPDWLDKLLAAPDAYFRLFVRAQRYRRGLTPATPVSRTSEVSSDSWSLQPRLGSRAESCH